MKKNEKKVFIFIFILVLSIIVSIWRVAIPRMKSSGLSSQKKVLILDIVGPIHFASGRPILQSLAKVAESSAVKGIILQINSPGGTVGTSQEIYQYIMKLRKKGIKVVAAMGDIAASGGYYIASAADTIVANPGTLTGSIGVIMNGWDFSKFLEKWGISSRSIKSGKMKDSGTPFRKMRPDEKKYLQALIMTSYNQFIRDILAGRKNKITENELRKLADGRVFVGAQAKDLKLIDALGGLEKAKDIIKKEIGNKDIQFVRPSSNIFEKMLGSLSKSGGHSWVFKNLMSPLMIYTGGRL